jgi:eukaryotic-like serine/threonine-protein kinase
MTQRSREPGRGLPRSTLPLMGDYELLSKVGEGGAGTVYKGRHRITGTIVAVKVMPVKLASNPLLLQRFEREFEAARHLNHPNLVRALDYGRAGDQPFLVMEFVEGESLAARLGRAGRLSEDEAIRLLVQISQGLHAAHEQGLVHRDVKPDNILVTSDGQAKLTDLGLVKRLTGATDLTQTGRGLGTPHFMAPEQFRDAKSVDLRCDIYSLGATLYQMVTGEVPFQSNTPFDAWLKKVNGELAPPRSLVPDLSERIDWVIQRAMSASPHVRPSSCLELIQDLTGPGGARRRGAAARERDVWHLVIVAEDGFRYTVSASTADVRRMLQGGLLHDVRGVELSRSEEGPFETLQTHPEFRELVQSQPNPVVSAKPAVTAVPARAAPTKFPRWCTWLILVGVAIGTALVGHFLTK